MSKKRKKQATSCYHFGHPALFLREDEWGVLECPCEELEECKREELKRVEERRMEFRGVYKLKKAKGE